MRAGLVNPQVREQDTTPGPSKTDNPDKELWNRCGLPLLRRARWWETESPARETGSGCRRGQ